MIASLFEFIDNIFKNHENKNIILAFLCNSAFAQDT